MNYIIQSIKGKSADYLAGFLQGVYTFAWMKDGIYYVGTTGTIYADVQTTIENEIDMKLGRVK